MRAIERKCGRKVGSSTFQLSSVISGKFKGETALVRLHFFSVSPLVVLVSSLTPGPWKDLVIPIASKCDTSSRSCCPTS